MQSTFFTLPGLTDYQRNKWVGKIRDVFLDADASDRLHAVETLAKLRYKIPAKERAVFEKAAKPDDAGMRHVGPCPVRRRRR